MSHISTHHTTLPNTTSVCKECNGRGFVGNAYCGRCVRGLVSVVKFKSFFGSKA